MLNDSQPYFPCLIPGFHLVRKSGEARKFYRGSGKVKEIKDFLEKVGESQGRKFLFMQLCNFNKKYYLHAEICVVELYPTLSSMYDVIICIKY